MKKRRKQTLTKNADSRSANSDSVKKKLSSDRKEPGPTRKKFFRFFTLLLPLFFFAFLEIALRIFGYGGNLDLFVSGTDEYAKYKKCNPLVARRYFSQQSEVPTPRNDLFLKKKPENGYRIFFLGGSTAAGYPYGENIMFSRILNQRLSDVFPDKYIEVVNTAITAVNSYTILDFIDEVLRNDPDAILIYAGHNEFYGALGVASAESFGRNRWIVKFYLKLNQFKTFRLLRNVVNALRHKVYGTSYPSAEIVSNATLMERMVSDQNIPFESSTYELGKNQFKKNLQGILSKAKRANIPVLISDLVSNIKDQAPFVSKKTGKFPPADEIYQNAKNLEDQNLFQKAIVNYYLAKDLDALRFRASEEFNVIIREVCQEYGMFLVPMQHYFENASPHNLIGDNLMLEHLHPNIKGYFLMTDCFFETMKKYHLISEKWDETKIKISQGYRNEWGLTELDSIYGDMRIRILKSGWPFKPKSGINNFLSGFTPNSEMEKLALRIWTDNSFTLEHGHVELAEYYEKNKEYGKAFKEYQALMCLTPLNNSPFLRAADLLIKSGRLSSALPILFKSLKLEPTLFANKWIGQILLNDGKIKEAIPYLENAYNISKNDPQLLYNLSGAYALNSQYREAKTILNILYEVNPRFPGADLLKNQLDKILTKQN